jgi:hypothetical protein
MMRLARRTSLLVAFHLLTSAVTASAECAWVLWGQIVSGSGSAYEAVLAGTRPECEREAIARRKVIAPSTPGTPEGYDPKTGQVLLFRYLPDTVDPRGPKGGER